MVGRSRYALPLSDSQARKFDALRARLDLRVLASAASSSTRGDGTFRLVPPFPVRPLDGALFHLLLPFRVARELRAHGADAVMAQGPFEGLSVLVGRRLAGSRARVIVELHGDWRTFPRLYGVPARRLLAPLTDRLGVWALRHADAVRALSDSTVRLAREAGVEPAATFIAFTDLDAFSGPPPAPLPERPSAVFVGVLEPYKNLDGLVEAWRRAAPRVPDATLRLVGRGRRRDLVAALLRELPERTSWTESLPTGGVIEAIDGAWALLLPSRSEGTPRIALEAMCRGRAVVGGRVGGVPDLVEDGVTGLLVDPDDVDAIADAIVRVLSDRALAERLGAAARERSAGLHFTPEQFAERVAGLVERVLS